MGTILIPGAGSQAGYEAVFWCGDVLRIAYRTGAVAAMVLGTIVQTAVLLGLIPRLGREGTALASSETRALINGSFADALPVPPEVSRRHVHPLVRPFAAASAIGRGI